VLSFIFWLCKRGRPHKDSNKVRTLRVQAFRSRSQFVTEPYALVLLAVQERQTHKKDSGKDCTFRIATEGLGVLLPHMTRQVIPCSLRALANLLHRRSVPCRNLNLGGKGGWKRGKEGKEGGREGKGKGRGKEGNPRLREPEVKEGKGGSQRV